MLRRRPFSRSAGLIIAISFALAFVLAPIITPSIACPTATKFLVQTSHVMSVLPTFGGRSAESSSGDDRVLDGLRGWMLVSCLGIGFGGE